MQNISWNIKIKGKPMSDICSAGTFYSDVMKKLTWNKFLLSSVMFGNKQPRYCILLINCLKVYKPCTTQLLTRLCIRILWLIGLTWQGCVPGLAHNQNFRNTAVCISLISRKSLRWETQQDCWQYIFQHFMHIAAQITTWFMHRTSWMVKAKDAILTDA